MWQRLLIALTVFGLGLSVATSSSDRQISPGPVADDETSAPLAHRSAKCWNCHWQAATAGRGEYGSIHEDQCRTCHFDITTMSGGLAEQFHNQADKACTQCHSFHETSKLIAGDRLFVSPADDGIRYQCRTCHDSKEMLENLSEGHRDTAIDFYHSDHRAEPDQSPSQSCMACHSDGAHATVRYRGGRPAISINSFASHPNETEVVSGQNGSFKNPIDPRIPLFENSIQCQSCHSLTSGVEHSLVEFATPYDLCLGCHDQSDQQFADVQ